MKRTIEDVTKEIDEVFEDLKKNKSDGELYDLKKQLEEIWKKINIIILREDTIH